MIPDGEAVEQVLRDSVTAGYDVAVTTGGTGLTPTDQTPEMTRRVIDREIPGIAEALRSAGAAAGVPSAILSRGLAGVASRTLIVNLPGSSGGVRDGMNVLRPILVHAVDQIRGGDHARRRHGRPTGRPRVPGTIALRSCAYARSDVRSLRGMIDAVGRIHGWPATLTEPDLLDAPVVLRPVRVSDARAWREIRVRNASWLRPWEPSNPETPLHRSSIGPYVVHGPHHAAGGQAGHRAALGGLLRRAVRRAAHRRVDRLGVVAVRADRLLDRRGVRRAAGSSPPRWRWPSTTASA